MTSPTPYDINDTQPADRDEVYPEYSYSSAEAGREASEEGAGGSGGSADPAAGTGAAAESAEPLGPSESSGSSGSSAAPGPAWPASYDPRWAGGYPAYPQWGYPVQGGYAVPGGYGGYPAHPQGSYPLPGAYAYPPPYSPPPQAAYVPGGQGVSERSKVAAGLLGLLLGGLGVHNFYLGYVGKGGAQLGMTVSGWLLFGSLFIVPETSGWMALAALLGVFVGLPMIAAVGIWCFVEAIIIMCATPGVPPWGTDAKGRALVS